MIVTITPNPGVDRTIEAGDHRDTEMVTRLLHRLDDTGTGATASEYLISAGVIRPGPVMVVERVAHAREHAECLQILIRKHPRGHPAPPSPEPEDPQAKSLRR